MSDEILGRPETDTCRGRAMQLLATSFQSMERYEDAMDVYQSALGVMQRHVVGMSGEQLQQHQSNICAVQHKISGALYELGRMDAQLDLLRDLHTRTMMCFPNSERMYESVVDLSDALCAQSHFAEAKSLLGRFAPLALETLGHGHIVAFKLRYNYASAIYMHHFFGYDGYTLDYEIALRMLRRLDKSLHREVACRPNTNDGDELTDLIDSHESLLAYALDNRLE